MVDWSNCLLMKLRNPVNTRGHFLQHDVTYRWCTCMQCRCMAIHRELTLVIRGLETKNAKQLKKQIERVSNKRNKHN